jgi:predicted dehydrogenase
VIRLGIIGCNFGRAVHLPAFRSDPRCEVVALAGTNAARVAELAKASNIRLAFSDWTELVDHDEIDAVTIATPPAVQSAIALRALALKKPIFVEKPLAADLATARQLRDSAIAAAVPAMIDFEFPEIAAWQQAKTMLDDGAIGGLRHVVISWNVENAAARLRLKNWKTNRDSGGGVLGNFVCHCLGYLEWFCGPVQAVSAKLFGLPGGEASEEYTALAMFRLQSGAAASLAMSCASFAGSGHRIEFYGDDGALGLINEGVDYMRGFRLMHARRPDTMTEVLVNDALASRHEDGRIAPVARLASRFLDAIEGKGATPPGLAEGYRVQQLMAAVRQSDERDAWVEVGALQ